MNPKNLIFLLIGFVAIAFVVSCERDWNNPWDEFNNLSPEAWAPQNLQIEDVSITEKKLTWTYGEKNIEGFKIDRKKGNDTWQVGYQTLPKETRNWSDTEIIPDPSLTYEYRLYAFAGKNSSSEETKSIAANFAPPTNLQTEKLSDKSYKLTWTDNSTGEQGFKIDRKINENNWVTAFGTVAANQTTFTDTNVFRATSVEYRMYGYYDSYESVKVTTKLNAALTSPTDLSVERTSLTTVILTWQTTGTGQDGFKIERKYEGGNWEQIATTKIANFPDNSFQLDTLVYYRVSAYVGQYNSTWATVNFDSAIPSPTDLEISQNTISLITLNWQHEIPGEDGFKIERKYEGGDWSLIATTTSTNYEDNDFQLNTQVYYRICAFFGQYFSSFAEKNFNSDIPAPTNLLITSNLMTSITLSWQENINGEEGFKIDRKKNSGVWELNYATVGSNQISFIDNNIDWQTLSDVYYYRVSAYFGQYNSSVIENSISGTCDITFTDVRDNNDYETIAIGTQCWMKENLAYLPNVSPSANGSETSPFYYVYGYEGNNVSSAEATANYQTYGVLYNWPAALNACPVGWHLPSDAEWTTLITYLGGESGAGGKMKETGTTHWQSPNTGATNSSGFTGLPGGNRHPNSNFYSIGEFGNWWSSTEYSSTNAWRRNLYYFNAIVYWSNINKAFGFSVRCLRD